MKLLEEESLFLLSEQKLKNKIQDYSKKFNVLPQQLYGLYGLEQLLKKIEKSDFRDAFVVKGGYLLSSTFGLNSRTTRDLDATIRNMKLTEEKVKELVDIITTPDEKGIQYFKLRKQSIIREKFDYDGYNLKFHFMIGKTIIPIELDLTTGEDLLPIHSNSKIPLIFEEGSIGMPSYPLEQILADKFYTTIAYASIDDRNSRTKDLYDIYFLTKFNEDIDYFKVNQSVEKTMIQRKMVISPTTYNDLLGSLEKSDFQYSQWSKFQTNHLYARNISFEEVLKSVSGLSLELLKISEMNSRNHQVE